MAEQINPAGETARQGEDPGATMPIGPHVSVAGELALAFSNGERVGASAIQIFTRNQRTWKVKPLREEEIEKFRTAWAASPIGEVMAHDSYLINLGSPEPEKLDRSRKAFAEEVERCEALGIRLMNFHPGAHMGSGAEAAIKRIAEGVKGVMATHPDADLIYTLENTAGQGSVVGSTIEELATLLEMLDDPERTGICLDTCHLFAAGYDLKDETGWNDFWNSFERKIGLKYLKAFHVNDAKKPVGSKLDRHEDLGEGCMGMSVFERLASDPRFLDIPMFLETPGGDEAWEKQITLMREFRRKACA